MRIPGASHFSYAFNCMVLTRGNAVKVAQSPHLGLYMARRLSHINTEGVSEAINRWVVTKVKNEFDPTDFVGFSNTLQIMRGTHMPPCYPEDKALAGLLCLYQNATPEGIARFLMKTTYTTRTVDLSPRPGFSEPILSSERENNAAAAGDVITRLDPNKRAQVMLEIYMKNQKLGTFFMWLLSQTTTTDKPSIFPPRAIP